MQTIRTITLSALLAGAFLSAGAFAGAPAGKTTALAPVAKAGNITVIIKSSDWPMPGMVTTEPCTHARCVEA